MADALSLSRGPKADPGRFFEDFQVGEELVHAVPRTVTEGDVALYTALFPARFAAPSSAPFARVMGYDGAPLESVLVFHVAFGKTVNDISLNAIANLGYADGRFGVPVYPGDTIRTVSRVTGVKANKEGTTGVVYVRSTATNALGEMVVEYDRWVMVRKRDAASPAPATVVPALPSAVTADRLTVPVTIPPGTYDGRLSGSPHAWEDYAVGERIDHVDGITIEEAEHMMAARLFQNTARVHFNQHVEAQGRFGRRIIYGGHIISLARGLSFNGLANAFAVIGINGGRHVAPTFAGDTIYAWSEVLEVAPLPGRSDVGALRLRTVACKDRSAADFPDKDAAGAYDPTVVLDFDYWVAVPRRVSFRG
jgi:2-methylfumaryl-CoA hydratase